VKETARPAHRPRARSEKTLVTSIDRRAALKLFVAAASAMAAGSRTAHAATSVARTLCEQLAEYVVGLRFESLPREVVSKAQDVILHNLAVAFGGVGTDQYNKAVDFVERRPGPATIIGQRFKTSVADAAFVNTIATRALRMEDNLVPSFTHPGACVLPAALALAEQSGASGRDVLTAVVAGYDIVGKIAGQVFGAFYARRSPSHIFVGLGVAAAAARMMRLDSEQTAGALTHACNLGALVGSGIEDFQYGIITRNGLFAAQLGKHRAPFPRDAFEGSRGFYAVQLYGHRPTTQEILGTLGTRYEILSTILKPYPCRGDNMGPTEILRTLVHRYKLTDAGVRQIRVLRSPLHADGPASIGPFTGYLKGRYAASSSLSFALAVILVDGELTPAHFDNPNEPRFVAAMRKIAVEFREGLAITDNEIVVEHTNGTTVSLKGGVEFFPQKTDERKVLALFGPQKVGHRNSAELARIVATLDQASNVGPLVKCLS
jgi:2-methylcitrate dehydratase PrpD